MEIDALFTTGLFFWSLARAGEHQGRARDFAFASLSRGTRPPTQIPLDRLTTLGLPCDPDVDRPARPPQPARVARPAPLVWAGPGVLQPALEMAPRVHTLDR